MVVNNSKTIADHARLTLASGQNVPSPCTSVCRISAVTGWCEGCFRTLDEIVRWSNSGEALRREVWGRIAQRAEALSAPSPCACAGEAAP